MLLPFFFASVMEQSLPWRAFLSTEPAEADISRGLTILASVVFLVGAACLLPACTKGTIGSSDAGPDGAVEDGDGAVFADDGAADAGDDGGQPGDGDQGTDQGGDQGGDQGADQGGDQGPADQSCEMLPAPEGNVVEVTPGQAGSLRQIVLDAQPHTTIMLADGTYQMDGGDNSSRLSFYTPDVTLRSASGDPAAVVLDGGYVTGEIVSIAASRVTIAEISLRRAYYHPIHVTGGDGASIEGVRIYRVRIEDPGEQAIKINTSGGGYFADRGSVECCKIELSDAGRPQIRNNCYTGGIDAHQAWGWTVRLNTIRGFWCQQGLSEHGIHFWVSCRDTLVERNTIIDCARGIGFGLGENGNGNQRVYADDPYPGIGYIGHYDGLIRNNFIAVDSTDLFGSEYGFDSGISLEQAHGTIVAHNSVVASQAPFSSIEWRFDNTDVSLLNNLVSHNLRDRGGQAGLQGNLENAPLSWFEDPPAGDLHLVSGAGALNAGVPLTAGTCDQDIDGQPRDERPDVGADERL